MNMVIRPPNVGGNDRHRLERLAASGLATSGCGAGRRRAAAFHERADARHRAAQRRRQSRRRHADELDLERLPRLVDRGGDLHGLPDVDPGSAHGILHRCRDLRPGRAHLRAGADDGPGRRRPLRAGLRRRPADRHGLCPGAQHLSRKPVGEGLRPAVGCLEHVDPGRPAGRRPVRALRRLARCLLRRDGDGRHPGRGRAPRPAAQRHERCQRARAGPARAADLCRDRRHVADGDRARRAGQGSAAGRRHRRPGPDLDDRSPLAAAAAADRRLLARQRDRRGTVALPAGRDCLQPAADLRGDLPAIAARARSAGGGLHGGGRLVRLDGHVSHRCRHAGAAQRQAADRRATHDGVGSARSGAADAAQTGAGRLSGDCAWSVPASARAGPSLRRGS